MVCVICQVAMKMLVGDYVTVLVLCISLTNGPSVTRVSLSRVLVCTNERMLSLVVVDRLFVVLCYVCVCRVFYYVVIYCYADMTTVLGQQCYTLVLFFLQIAL